MKPTLSHYRTRKPTDWLYLFIGICLGIAGGLAFVIATL